jgi:hypothetical protein
MKKIIVGAYIAAALIFVIAAGVAIYKFNFINHKVGRACTLEAKLCPDGSAVGRIGPNCEFAACPQSDSAPARVNPKAPTSQALTRLFAEKYPKYSKTVSVKITKETENFARGDVIFEAGAPGGIFLATKINEKWQIVHDGNGQIPCNLSKYGFPADMLSDCAK